MADRINAASAAPGRRVFPVAEEGLGQAGTETRRTWWNEFRLRARRIEWPADNGAEQPFLRAEEVQQHAWVHTGVARDRPQ
jgi:hypothetical protein